MVSVACGSLHCVVSTDRGEVYTWGDNDEGQLGDGTTNAVHKPTLLQSLVVWSLSFVFLVSIVMFCFCFLVLIPQVQFNFYKSE